MTLGERVKYVRERKEWTLHELSRKAGINVSYLLRIENGKHKRLSIETAKSLAKALGVTVDYLVGMYDEESEQEPANVVLVDA